MSRIKVTRGTGNVYADIGLPDAKEHKVRADLVCHLAKCIEQESITQTEAAERLGVSQPEISRMLEGHFRSHSVEWLMQMLTKLGVDVRNEILAPKAPKKTGSSTEG